MFSLDDVIAPSEEDKIISCEEQLERLSKYGDKIDSLLIVILNEKERLIFNKKIVNGRTFTQISQELGLPRGNIESALKTIDKKLEAFRRFIALL